ncbi:hypothetical protein MRB53_033915 [Persea americana]|uniref:Uncharacterized protein n=1 Tax=Persea americana TaxID=3435 RepID=A0ACC2KWM9_PERAE|nr:hypothetical protein MRB53_033915 [Persea americana]
MSHQHMDEAPDNPTENPFYKPANEASISENSSTDHGSIRQDGLSYHREKKPRLNHETAYELKNQNVCTTDNKKENVGNVSDENVKEQASFSENNSIDHGAIRAYGIFYHSETDHQLNNRNGYIADNKEENTCNASNEHVEEDEVSHRVRSDHTCLVCKRDFKSMKSLSGHMRCHPERSWRGIQPPPTEKNRVSSTIIESGGQKMVDQNYSATTMESSSSNRLPVLAKWFVKRSRYMETTHTLKVPNSLENKKYEENKAVGNSFKPSCEDSLEWEQGRKKQVCEGSKANSMNSDQLVKPRPQEQENVSGNEFKFEFTKSDYKTETILSLEKMDNSKNQMQIPFRTEVEKKRKSASSASHICRTCNKSFNSHQALGGHMTGHKKDSKSATKVDAISVACTTKDVQYESLNAVQSKPLPEFDAPCSNGDMVHRCKVCSKTFPSGQALGGHQRCHWSGGVQTSTTSIKLQEDENRTHRRIFKFDLNELAMAESEHDLELNLGLELKLGSSTI